MKHSDHTPEDRVHASVNDAGSGIEAEASGSGVAAAKPKNSDELRKKRAEELLRKDTWKSKFEILDVVFAILAVVVAFYASHKLIEHDLSIYEKMIFVLAVGTVIFLMWIFKGMRWFLLAATILTGWSISMYGGDLAAPESKFMLKYILSSQSAIMWQCFLAVLAFVFFLVGFIVDATKKTPIVKENSFTDGGIVLSWISACMGLVGLLVRWYETYLLPAAGMGHIPLTNIYEVFVLFIMIVPLMFLYYARTHEIKRLGVFVYILQLILVSFIVWYSVARSGQEIQPLIPALKSWWLKLHVPANFVGYGGFCIAAMLAIAELFALRQEERFAKIKAEGGTPPNGFWPHSDTIETIMYKCIAVGFLFFTIATILGALWAADAWGRYWSWDPKETWALIVWINYAVWLHMRFIKGLRGRVLAWWALVGFLVTSFAFVGVNFFLSGLHSYGQL